MTFTAHIEEEFAAAHANGPDGHKCNVMHGHDWRGTVEFTYVDLDGNGWGPDFGFVKSFIKGLDHQNLNELFDGMHSIGDFALPRMKPSAENVAKWLFHTIQQATGVKPDFVTVEEGGGNEVTYTA